MIVILLLLLYLQIFESLVTIFDMLVSLVTANYLLDLTSKKRSLLLQNLHLIYVFYLAHLSFTTSSTTFTDIEAVRKTVNNESQSKL